MSEPTEKSPKVLAVRLTVLTEDGKLLSREYSGIEEVKMIQSVTGPERAFNLNLEFRYLHSKEIP